MRHLTRCVAADAGKILLNLACARQGALNMRQHVFGADMLQES